MPEKPSPALDPRRRPYLDAVTEHLEQVRNVRGLICLVERWAALETPTREARLRQVRAFLDLKLMDRAWLVLKQLLQAEPSEPDAAILAVELFLARGWPARARRMLDEARGSWPHHPTLQRLATEVDRPLPPLPSDLRDVERDGDPARMLELAERFLASGSFLRARSLLERLRVAEPANQRIKDLLWGLAGEFDAGDLSPEELGRQLAPGVTDPEGAEPLDLIGGDEVTAARIPLEEENQDVDFPALFRRVDASDALLDDETGEVTQAAFMASPEELVDPDRAGAGPQGVLPAHHDDTEIMMVIQGGGVVPVEDPGATTHRRRESEYDLRATLDLEAYRSHMGMAPPPASDLPSDRDVEEEDGSDLEEEDADLVVVTRRETRAAAAVPAPALRPPMRVIERVPLPSAPEAPAEPPRAPPPAPSAAPRPPARQPLAERAPRPRPRKELFDADTRIFRAPRRARWRVPALVGVGVALGVLGWAAGMLRGGLEARVEQAVDADRWADLLALEETLSQADPADAEARAALARVKVALWRDFDPNPAHLDRARSLLASPAMEETPLVHLARAELAAEEWRTADARAALAARAVEDEEALLVRAALATAEGDAAAAAQAAEAATSADTSSARAWRVLTEARWRAGETAGAQAALARARKLLPDDPRVRLQEALLAGGPPEDLEREAREIHRRLSERYTPRRVTVDLMLDTAAAFRAMGDTARAGAALRQAVRTGDPLPELLFLAALDDLDAQRLLVALERVERAARYRPGDVPAQALRLRILLDLDRVTEATEALETLRRARPDHPWLAVAEAWLLTLGAAAPPDADRVRALLGDLAEGDAPDGEALWLRGLARARAGAAGSNDDLAAAVEALRRSDDPARWRLIPRALAARVLAGDPQADWFEHTVLETFPNDPWVHLVLGWGAEARNDRPGAIRHLGRAVEAGPELARAHWELARLRGREATGTLRRYLDLSPTGPRADAAQGWVAARSP